MIRDYDEALLGAALDNDTEKLTYCLDRAADINYQNEFGSTALSIASYHGHLQAVHVLLQHWASPYVEDKQGNRPLTDACMGEGDFDVIRLLFEQDSNGHEEPNNEGKTALSYACQNNNVEAVELFLGSTCHLEQKDNLGHTALFDAGSVEIAKLLLERGAHMNIEANNGDTPFSWACKNDRVEVAELLLDRGANILHKNKEGKTPLVLASENGKTKAVQLLLDRGCHVDLGDCHRSTPLLVACKNGHWRTVKLLLDRGANLEHHDNSNWTALALASMAGHVDTVRILMERGAGIHLAVLWETSKGSRRIVTPTMARAGMGRTGASSTNSKDKSMMNNNMKTQQKRKRRMN